MPTIDLKSPSEQLDGHIKSFGKVLYTNGLQWYFYIKNDIYKKELIWDYQLGKLENGKIKWSDEINWIDLLAEIDKIDWRY